MVETKLRHLIEESGYSIAAYARMVDVPQSTLQRIVSGDVRLSAVTVGTFLKIAHGLGLTAEELLYDDCHYTEAKREVDRAYASTSIEGRLAMVACARGVLDTFPNAEEYALPTMEDANPDLSLV